MRTRGDWLGSARLWRFFSSAPLRRAAGTTARKRFRNIWALAGTAGPASAVQAPGPGTLQPQSLASIAGTVRDTRGTLFAGVPVTLAGEDNTVKQVVIADDNGAFTFANLPAGTYQVQIYVAGLEPFISAPVVIGAGEESLNCLSWQCASPPRIRRLTLRRR